MKLAEATIIAEALAQARASVFMSDHVAIIDNAIRKVALAIADMTSETTSEAEYRIGLFCNKAMRAPTYKPRTFTGLPMAETRDIGSLPKP